MSKPERRRTGLIVCCVVLATVIFLVDVSLPLGVAGGVPYVALVLLSLWLPDRRHTVMAATAGTVLTALGFVFSPPAGIMWMVIFNRFLALFAIWVTAILSLHRKSAEEERELLIQAIEQTGEAIVITDPEATIQYVNPAFERITGYRRGEVIGRATSLLRSGKHDRSFFEEMWSTITGGEIWRGRITNKRKDGSFYTEDATISPVRDASGQTINYVAVKRDITQKMILEEQLRQAQKMEAVGQLAGGIAHDFNNLLQAINGYVELALTDLREEHAARRNIEEVARQGRRAAALVRQLLAYSRRQLLDIKDVNLNDPVIGLIKMIRPIIGEHISLRHLADNDLGVVRADPSQIEQILMNLCINARDAMAEGGTITIKTENARLDEAYCRVHSWATQGRFVLLSVTDDGCGMDEKTRLNAFEPFFTTKGVGEGTGLGLATVYGLVRQHRGLVHIYSEVGKGTSVKIYLPLVERSAAVEGTKVEAPPAAR